MMRVFIVNFHRTGTRSVSEFFTRLGLSSIHYPREVSGIDLECQLSGHESNEEIWELLRPLMSQYNVFADVPFPALYEQAFREYPDAYFLYIHRDPENWASAAHRFLTLRGRFTALERIQYRAYLSNELLEYTADVSIEKLIFAHQSHYTALTSFFENEVSERFLVHSLGTDFGPELCAQLGAPPYISMPHLGKTQPIKKQEKSQSNLLVQIPQGTTIEELLTAIQLWPISPHFRYLAARKLLMSLKTRKARTFANQAVQMRPAFLPYRRLAILLSVLSGKPRGAFSEIRHYFSSVGGIRGFAKHLVMAWSGKKW